MAIEDAFEFERARLVRLAAGILGERHEAEDIVQTAWLRLHSADAETIHSLPAWLTTVTTRLCLDRLRAKVPDPVDPGEHWDDAAGSDIGIDPFEEVALADSVGVALNMVVGSLTPSERVAFILHDTFSGTSRPCPRAGLISSRGAQTGLAGSSQDQPNSRADHLDWEVVDAFLTLPRRRLRPVVHLLCPGVVVSADAAAIAAGTPERLEGRDAVAAMFDGAARAAPARVCRLAPRRRGFDRGAARVIFDFTVVDGQITSIVFRAAPEVITAVVRRRGASTALPRTTLACHI